MSVNDAENPKPQSPAQGDGSAPEARQETPEATAQREKELLEELHQTRLDLERSRGEHETTTRRLDEIARAYSALVSDQKDFRGRLEREKERVLENERGKVAHELLEIGDELERALAAAAGDEGPLAQGVRLIREGLMRRLTAMGIKRMELTGKPFDPNVAEAIDLVPVDDRKLDDQVVAETIPGYTLGERVLRPARVRVARFVEPAKADGRQPNGPES